MMVRQALPWVMMPYMVATQKTTVYLETDAYRRLKALARRRGVPPAQLIREAIAVYADAHERRRLPKSAGAGASGQADLGSRADELLAGGFGDPSR
jgi:hypothetical protein